jgi:hypothetical protein
MNSEGLELTKPNFLIAPRSTGARDVDRKKYAGYDWSQTHYKLVVSNF